MAKLVLDTNVLISALIKRGKPRALFLEVVRGRVQLILSREILDEFIEVAADTRIRKYVNEEDLTKFLRIIGSVAKVIKVRSKFKIVKQDPSDDAILRTAHDGKADCIVSGDSHLLSLKEFKGIKIVTVSESLKLLKG